MPCARGPNQNQAVVPRRTGGSQEKRSRSFLGETRLVQIGRKSWADPDLADAAAGGQTRRPDGNRRAKIAAARRLGTAIVRAGAGASRRGGRTGRDAPVHVLAALLRRRQGRRRPLLPQIAPPQ